MFVSCYLVLVGTYWGVDLFSERQNWRQFIVKSKDDKQFRKHDPQSKYERM